MCISQTGKVWKVVYFLHKSYAYQIVLAVKNKPFTERLPYYSVRALLSMAYLLYLFLGVIDSGIQEGVFLLSLCWIKACEQITAKLTLFTVIRPELFSMRLTVQHLREKVTWVLSWILSDWFFFLWSKRSRDKRVYEIEENFRCKLSWLVRIEYLFYFYFSRRSR